jgi:bacteriocin-like protein
MKEIQVTELNANELEQIVGGIGESTSTDPATGETVVYDCTGREIGRYMSYVTGG